MKINLVDINDKMTDAWETEFSSFADIKIYNSSIFDVPADAIVSPANSFGIMDGGIDGKIRDYFGYDIERKVRMIINSEYYGELPVGCSVVTSTGDKTFKYLISAPTMRVPENVSNTLNAYLAMRALLRSCLESGIGSVSVPGLCALSGSMSYKVVSRQMRVAYERICLQRINYSHWREEKYLEDYLMCKSDILPDDLERK